MKFYILYLGTVSKLCVLSPYEKLRVDKMYFLRAFSIKCSVKFWSILNLVTVNHQNGLMVIFCYFILDMNSILFCDC